MTSMQSEHEEAMRSDFHDQITERWKALQPSVTEAERREITGRAFERDQRWRSGAYAVDWDFLHMVYSDFRDYPHAMQGFAEALDVSDNVWEDYGLTEDMRRSVIQARNIAHEEHLAIEALHQQRTPIRRER
ncbi:hypothetical protein [Nocardia sp. NPDC051981]|uniref:hypothetical protein n=1 Tax=Nocardia sp. NPDC051981 TaxID=3155417 RepID=UPI003431BD91